MGSAQSSNVASAVSNVSNFVSNSTTANTAQVNSIQDLINLNNCQIDLQGDFNVATTSTILQQNTQVFTAKQDANVANNIQQQMLQEATSKVGMLGIGFANANNSCSEMVNATSTISNAMTDNVLQYSTDSNSFNCNNSVIIADNLNIGFNTQADFLSNETLNNSQVADITNNISQTVQQTATATVQGLGSLLFMIVLIIGIIIWGVTKTLSSGGVKIATAIIIFALVIAAVVFMYLKSTPPFFSDPIECLKHTGMGLGNSNCINYTQQTFNLSSIPLRYSLALLPENQTTSGGNLLQMAISSAAGQTITSGGGDNGGYRIDVLNKLETRLNAFSDLATQLGIPLPPNPLYNPAPTSTNCPTSYLAIPIEYLTSAKGGSGDSSSICTPGTLQVQVGAPTPAPATCPQVIDPKLLQCTTNPSSALANLNDAGWSTYITSASGSGNDTPLMRSLFGRFCLCSIIGNIPLHIFAFPNEPVSFNDGNNTQMGPASSYPNDCYLFNSNNEPDPLWASALTGGGVLIGPIGVVDDKTYRFNKFMKNIGGYILMGLLGVAVLILIYNWYINKNKDINKDTNTPNKN